MMVFKKHALWHIYAPGLFFLEFLYLYSFDAYELSKQIRNRLMMY